MQTRNSTFLRIAACLLGGLMSAAAVAAAEKPLQIVAVDVEGGAATLFVTPDGKSLLIDTGWPGTIGATSPGSADRIIEAARKLSLKKIDYLLVTHYHVDHVGGLPELIGKFPVGTILDHGPNRELPAANASQAAQAMHPQTLYSGYESAIAGHPRRSLKPGDKVKIGALTLTTVTSDREVPRKPMSGAGKTTPECAGMTDMARDGGEENARSVGVLLTYRKVRIVALGDLTWNAEKALVCPVNKLGRADLWFVSHHGSNLSNSPALVNAVAPRVAVVANGARKGGDRETFDTVSKSPGLQGLFALHYAENAGREHNPDEACIVNPDARNDQHLSLHVSVFRDGTLKVTNERTGRSWTYSR
jgi:beta-lactamase superfamily II metal-dependent hydrolase